MECISLWAGIDLFSARLSLTYKTINPAEAEAKTAEMHKKLLDRFVALSYPDNGEEVVREYLDNPESPQSQQFGKDWAKAVAMLGIARSKMAMVADEKLGKKDASVTRHINLSDQILDNVVASYVQENTSNGEPALTAVEIPEVPTTETTEDGGVEEDLESSEGPGASQDTPIVATKHADFDLSSIKDSDTRSISSVIQDMMGESRMHLFGEFISFLHDQVAKGWIDQEVDQYGNVIGFSSVEHSSRAILGNVNDIMVKYYTSRAQGTIDTSNKTNGTSQKYMYFEEGNLPKNISLDSEGEGYKIYKHNLITDGRMQASGNQQELYIITAPTFDDAVTALRTDLQGISVDHFNDNSVNEDGSPKPMAKAEDHIDNRFSNLSVVDKHFDEDMKEVLFSYMLSNNYAQILKHFYPQLAKGFKSKYRVGYVANDTTVAASDQDSATVFVHKRTTPRLNVVVEGGKVTSINKNSDSPYLKAVDFELIADIITEKGFRRDAKGLAEDIKNEFTSHPDEATSAILASIYYRFFAPEDFQVTAIEKGNEVTRTYRSYQGLIDKNSNESVDLEEYKSWADKRDEGKPAPFITSNKNIDKSLSGIITSLNSTVKHESFMSSNGVGKMTNTKSYNILSKFKAEMATYPRSIEKAGKVYTNPDVLTGLKVRTMTGTTDKMLEIEIENPTGKNLVYKVKINPIVNGNFKGGFPFTITEFASDNLSFTELRSIFNQFSLGTAILSNNFMVEFSSATRMIESQEQKTRALEQFLLSSVLMAEMNKETSDVMNLITVDTPTTYGNPFKYDPVDTMFGYKKALEAGLRGIYGEDGKVYALDHSMNKMAIVTPKNKISESATLAKKMGGDKSIHRGGLLTGATPSVQILGFYTKTGIKVGETIKKNQDMSIHEQTELQVEQAFLQTLANSNFEETALQFGVFSDKTNIPLTKLRAGKDFFFPVTTNGEGLDTKILRDRTINSQKTYWNNLSGEIKKGWLMAVRSLPFPVDISENDSIFEMDRKLREAQIPYGEFTLTDSDGNVQVHHGLSASSGLVKNAMLTVGPDGIAVIPRHILNNVALFNDPALSQAFIESNFKMFKQALTDEGYKTISDLSLDILKKKMPGATIDKTTGRDILLEAFFHNSNTLGQELLRIHTGGFAQFKIPKHSSIIVMNSLGGISINATLANVKAIQINNEEGVKVPLESLSLDQVVALTGDSKNKINILYSAILNNKSLSDEAKAKAIIFDDMSVVNSSQYIDQVKRNAGMSSTGQHPRLAGAHEPGVFLGQSSKNITIEDPSFLVDILGKSSKKGDDEQDIYDAVQIGHPLYFIKLGNSLGGAESNYSPTGAPIKDITNEVDENGFYRFQKKATFDMFNTELLSKGTNELYNMLVKMNTAVKFNTPFAIVPRIDTATGKPIRGEFSTPITEEMWLNGGHALEMVYDASTETTDENGKVTADIVTMESLLRPLKEGNAAQKKAAIAALRTKLATGQLRTDKIQKNFRDIQGLWEYFGSVDNKNAWNMVANVVGNHSVTTDDFSLENATFAMRDAYVEKAGFKTQEKTGSKQLLAASSLTDPSYEFGSNNFKGWSEVDNTYHCVILQADHNPDTSVGTKSYSPRGEEAEDPNHIPMITQILSAIVGEGNSREDVVAVYRAVGISSQIFTKEVDQKISDIVEKIAQEKSITNGTEAYRQLKTDATFEYLTGVLKKNLATREAPGIAGDLVSDTHKERLSFDIKQILPVATSSVNSDFNRNTVRMTFPGGQYIVAPSHDFIKTFTVAGRDGFTRADINKISMNPNHALYNTIMEDPQFALAVPVVSDLMPADVLTISTVNPTYAPLFEKLGVKDGEKIKYSKLRRLLAEVDPANVDELVHNFVTDNAKFRFGSARQSDNRLKWTQYQRHNLDGTKTNISDTEEYKAFQSVNRLMKGEVGLDHNGSNEIRFFLDGQYEKQKGSVRVTENFEPGDFSIHEGDLTGLSKEDRIKLFTAQDMAIPEGGRIVNRSKSSFDGLRHRLNLSNHGWTVSKKQSHNQGFKSNDIAAIKAFAVLHGLGRVYQNNKPKALEGGIEQGDYYVKGITLTRTPGATVQTELVPKNIVRHYYFSAGPGAPSSSLDVFTELQLKEFDSWYLANKQIAQVNTINFISKTNKKDLVKHFEKPLYNLLQEDGWSSEPAEFYMPSMHKKTFLLHDTDSLYDIIGAASPDFNKLISLGIIKPGTYSNAAGTKTVTFSNNEDIYRQLNTNFADINSILGIATSQHFQSMSPEHQTIWREVKADRDAQNKSMLKFFKQRVTKQYSDSFNAFRTAPTVELAVDRLEKTISKQSQGSEYQQVLSALLNELKASTQDVYGPVMSPEEILNRVFKQGEYPNAPINQFINKKAAKLASGFTTSLEFITARIPAQGKQSGTIGKIKNFVFSTRNSCYGPLEMLKMTGADYDIDKQNMMTWAFDEDGVLIDWKPFLDTNGQISMDKFNTWSAGKSPKEANAHFKSAIQNFIVHKITTVFKAPKNAIEANTPVSMEKTKQAKKEPDLTKASTAKSVEDILRLREHASPFNPADMFKYEKLNMDGKSGIGIFASDLKGYFAAYFSTITSNPETEGKFIKFKSNSGLTSVQAESLGVKQDAIQYFDLKTGELVAQSSTIANSGKYVGEGKIISDNAAKGLQELKSVSKDALYSGYVAGIIPAELTAKIDALVSSHAEPAVTDEEGFARIEAAAGMVADAEQIRIINKYINDIHSNNNANVDEQAWEDLSELLSAATDNAKELILGQINATSATSSIISTMVRMGIDLKYALQLVGHTDPSAPARTVRIGTENKTDIRDIRGLIRAISEVGDTQKEGEGFARLLPVLEKMQVELPIAASKAEIEKHLKDPFRQLYTFAKMTEEFGLLSSMLSLNQGLKNSAFESWKFISGMEARLNDITEGKPVFVFKKFIDSASKSVGEGGDGGVYMNSIIEAFDGKRDGINIPFVLSKNSHYFGYYEAMFKAKELLGVVSRVDATVESIIDKMTLKSPRLKRKVQDGDYKGIQNLIYGIGVEGYMKDIVKPFVINGKVFDLGVATSPMKSDSDVGGRYEFIQYLPEAVNEASSFGADNHFLASIPAQDSAVDYVTQLRVPVLKGPNLHHITADRFAELKVGLSALKKSNRELYDALFLYSLITNKGGYASGSFIALYDAEKYVDFSGYIKKNAGVIASIAMNSSNDAIVRYNNPVFIEAVSTSKDNIKQYEKAAASNEDITEDYFDYFGEGEENHFDNEGDFEEMSRRKTYLDMKEKLFHTEGITKGKLSTKGIKEDIIRSKETGLIYKWDKLTKMWIPMVQRIPGLVIPFTGVSQKGLISDTGFDEGWETTLPETTPSGDPVKAKIISYVDKYFQTRFKKDLATNLGIAENTNFAGEQYLIKRDDGRYEIVTKQYLLSGSTDGLELSQHRIGKRYSTTKERYKADVKQGFFSLNGVIYDRQVEGSVPTNTLTVSPSRIGKARNMFGGLTVDNTEKAMDGIDKSKMFNMSEGKLNNEFEVLRNQFLANAVNEQFSTFDLDKLNNLHNNRERRQAASIVKETNDLFDTQASSVSKLITLYRAKQILADRFSTVDGSRITPETNPDIVKGKAPSIAVESLKDQTLLDNTSWGQVQQLMKLMGVSDERFDGMVKTSLLGTGGKLDVYIGHEEARNKPDGTIEMVSRVIANKEVKPREFTPFSMEHEVPNDLRNKFNRTVSPDVLNSLINAMNDRFPGSKFSRMGTAQIEEQFGKEYSKPGVKAFVINGEVIFNQERMTLDTPIHEYAHIYMQHLKLEDPGLYHKLVTESLAHPLADSMGKAYGDITRFELGEEVFVSLVAAHMMGETIDNPHLTALLDATSKGSTVFGRLLDFFKSIFSKAFGVSPEKMDLSLTDSLGTIIQKLGDEMAFGKDSMLNNFSSETKQLITQSRKGATIDYKQVLDLLTEKGFIQRVCA